MQPAKRPSFLPGRAALLACASLVAPIAYGQSQNPSGIASREVQRRTANVEEARELLRMGDLAYNAGRFNDAIVAFTGARDLLPEAPTTAALRDAATERYAQAATEQARELSRKGDVAAAKTLLDQVLAPTVAPTHPGASTLRDQLDDPIRTNPALDAAHAANVDQVRRLLYTAEGAFNLAKFDQAKETYDAVLNIDPYNQAARRGIERVAAAKSSHAASAQDQTRADMLSQVAAAWELPLGGGMVDVPVGDIPLGQDDPTFVPASRKLDRIILPSINLDQASIEEAIELLRVRAAEFDTTETDPARKGLNFNLRLGGADSEIGNSIRAIRFDLRLSNVPLSTVLRYITELTRTTLTTDDFSVIIHPLGSDDNTLINRSFRVPADFLSSLSSRNAGNNAADPFAEPANRGAGLLAVRRGAREILTEQGISFPDGANAVYNPANSTLRVTNTAANLDIISQLVDAVAQTEPVMVAVSITMIRIQEKRLQELGFDWILDQFGFAGDSWIPGADVLNLTGGTIGNGGSLADVAMNLGQIDRRPITAGNRSGDSAIAQDSIDSLLAIGTTGSRPLDARAPGALWFSGALNDGGVQMLVRALDQDSGADLMANPSTVTRSGQEASVQIVREFIYPSEFEPPELPNTVGDPEFGDAGGGISPVTPAHPTAFVTRNVGIELNVLPTADANRRFVEVTLNPVVTDFDGFVNLGTPITSPPPSGFGALFGNNEPVVITPNAIRMPIFSTQRAQTSVTVLDGATMVIGGLIEERIQNVEDKTPVLGDIPVVGRFFQSNATQTVSKAIIFLVNVRLIDPTGRPFNDR